jgi:hypothetical protein
MGMRHTHNVVMYKFLLDNCRRTIWALQGYTDIRANCELRSKTKHCWSCLLHQITPHDTLFAFNRSLTPTDNICLHEIPTPVEAINSMPTDGTADSPARIANSLPTHRDKRNPFFFFLVFFSAYWPSLLLHAEEITTKQLEGKCSLYCTAFPRTVFASNDGLAALCRVVNWREYVCLHR